MKKNRLKALHGKDIYLSSVNSNDAEEYYALLFEQDTRKRTGTKPLFTYDQVAAYLHEECVRCSSILLFICLKSNDEIIGDIALQDIDASNRKAGVRIAIPQDIHQGKGYGSEALRLVLEYGFGQLQLHRIELEVFAFNDRALHVYEKLGFKVEGRQRDALFYDHRYYDAILMSFLEEEYRTKYALT